MRKILQPAIIRLRFLISLLIVSASVFAQQHTFTAFSPSNAATGETVVLTGTNFTGVSGVSFGGTAAASFTIVSATRINAVVAGGTSGSISITKPTFTTATRTGFIYSAIPNVTSIITDFGGYWNTNITTNNPTFPDNSHNVAAFAYGGGYYSTGVNDALLTSKGITYSPATFRAFPALLTGTSPTNPNTGAFYIAAGAKVDGNAALGLYTNSAIRNLTLSTVLTDGINGLDIGTGYTNLPTTAVQTFSVFSILPSKITDNEPDILVTQIADPPAGTIDTYQFQDVNNNVVGTAVTQDLSLISQLGTWRLDLFNTTASSPYSAVKPTGIASANTTRPIRVVAYKLSDFGITASNYTQVKSFRIIPSGTSDVAFVAYNATAVNLPPSISQNTNTTSSVICITGTSKAQLGVSAIAAGGGSLSYAWFVSTNNGTSFSAVSNGGIYSGATTNTLGIADGTAGYQYYCEVTESGSNLTSRSATFTITSASSTALGGTLNPTPLNLCVNSVATGTSLSVAPTGGTGSYTYQWSSSSTSGGTYTDISGAINASYDPPLNVVGTIYYKVLVSSGCLTNLSTATAVTITGAEILTTTDGASCNAGTVTLRATASGGTITWYSAAAAGTQLATGSPYTTTSISATTTYYVSANTTTPTCTSNRVPVVATIVNTITLNSSNFSIEYASNACAGSASVVSVASSALPDGTYTVNYDITGANSSSGRTATMVFASGAGTFNTIALATAGTSTITITGVVTSGSNCTISANAAANATVNATSVGGSIAGSATVCSGTNSTTLTLSGQTGSIVKWQSSTASDFSTALTDIANTTTTLTASNLTATTYYRAVVQSGVCASANSATGTVTVNATSVGGSIAGSATVCSGTNSTTLTLSGQTGSIVKWQSSTASDFSTALTDIANTTTTLTATNLTATTYYRAVVQSGVCASANSATGTVTVNATSVGGSIAGSATVCSGTNSTTLTLSGQTGSIVKWQSSTASDFSTALTDIANTTTTLTATNLTATTYYRAVVQSGVCASANSATGTVTVNATSVGGSIGGSATVCSGTNSTTLTLSGQTGSIVKWQSSTASDFSTALTDIANTTTTLTATNLTATTYYRAVVQNGVCASANSATGTVTVNATSVGGSIGGSATVCSGTNSTTLTLSGQTGSIVKWQSSTASDFSTALTDIANTTTTLTATNLTATTYYRAVVQNGVCASANSATGTVTVNATSVGGSIGGSATVCSGTNSTTLTLSGQTGSIVKWQSSTASDFSTALTDIANTTTTLTATNLTATTYYRAVVQNGVCASANSATGTVTVNATSVGGSIGGSATVCSGTNSTTLTLSGQTGSIVKWQSSTASDFSTALTDIANTTTTLTASNLTATTYYRAVVQSGVCASANSATGTVTVNATSVGGSIAGSATVCSGTNSTTLTLSGQTGSIVKWQSSTASDFSTALTDIANTTTTLTASNLTATTYYRAVVQSGVCASANSATGTVTVNATSVGGSIGGSATVCSGTNSTTLTLSGQTGSIVKWQSSTASDFSTALTDIANTTTTLTASNLTATTYYRAVVQSGVCASANSATGTVTVNATSVGGSIGGSATVCSGTNSTTLTLSGQTGSIVKWQSSTASDFSTALTDIANTTTTLTATNLTATTYYRAVVQSGVCASANSATGTVTVNATSVGGSIGGSATVCSGTNSTTLTLSGQTGSIVKWQSSTASDFSTALTDIANTTTTLTASNLTATTYYRAVVQSGVCASANSATGTVTVNATSVGGSIGGSATVCSGTNSTTLTLSGQTGSIVKWQSSTASDFSTALTDIANTTTTLTATNLTATTYYRAVVQSGVCASANSATGTVTVNATSVGGSIGGSATVCSGTNSTTLTLSGQTGSIVKWQSSTASDFSTALTDIANTTTTLTATNLTATTYYRAVVQSGVCASANSATGTVTVNATSVGGSIGGSATVCSGTNSTTLTLSGQTGSIVKWQSSTASDFSTALTDIANTTTTLTATNLTATTYYRAVVQSGVCASANSATGTVTVNATSVGGSIGGSATVCSGTNSTTLTLSGQTGSIVKWQSSTASDFSTALTDIANTTTTLTATNLTATTYYRAVVQSGVCASANSATGTVTVNATSVGGSIGGSATVCSGTNSTTLTLSGQTGSIVKWQSSTASDFSTALTDIANTTTTLTATNLTATTYYRAVVQSGVCASANSATGTVTVSTPPVFTGEPASSQFIATGNIVTLTVSASGGTGYQWTKDNTDISGATSTSLTFSPLTVNDNGVYRLRVASGACTATSNAYEVIPSIVLYSKPTGIGNVAANWGVNTDGSGSTPVDFTRDEHTFVVANRASLSTGGNLTIAGTLDLKDGITVITPGYTLIAGVVKRTGTTGTISGSSTSNLGITGIQGATNSNLWFTTGNQVLKDLTITNVTTTLNTPLTITGGVSNNTSGTVSVTNGLLATNDNLTLNSNIYGTASVAPGSNSGNYITGNVSVERFIPQNLTRGWRLLSIPTVGQTMHESWQENQPALVNPFTGYGTNLTCNTADWQARGYDERTPLNSTLYFDLTAQQLKPVASTFSPIATDGGYFVYIRGDRGVTQSYSISTINSTTLRTKGAIFQGTQPAISIPAGKQRLVGNIYPSAIDLRNLVLTGGIVKTFHVWDPKLRGSYNLGAYVTLTYDEIQGDYIGVPGDGSANSSYGPSGTPNNKIESGLAFFASAQTSAGTIQFTESAKAAGSRSSVFAPPGTMSKRFITNLYAVADTGVSLADGTLHLINSNYSNDVDGNDSYKLSNSGENFYLGKGSADLSAEKRQDFTESDTVFYKMRKLKAISYLLQFTPAGLENSNLSAFLEDKYLLTSTSVSLGSATTYKFNVDANAASAAIDRFRIVFKQNAILPVTFTGIKAYQQNSNIAVEWKVANQQGVSYYEVEKSANGRNFTKVGTVAASTANASELSYAWLDEHAISGDNYYRVISVDANGGKHYTQVVKVNIAARQGYVRIFPNPVTNGIIRIQFNDLAAGTYVLRLLSPDGKSLLVRKVVKGVANGYETLRADARLPAGSYLLEVTHPDKTQTVENLVIVK